jgi:predicted class III extradiol MEMO1 family dioxygenase
VGLISPHIDYHRGWPVYARLWRQAAPALRAADVVVIFGTDHAGAPGTLTLARRPYATPWGVLPNDPDVIDAMASVLGEEAAFGEELHHRAEHSVELAAVWLHHVRDREPVTVIPVLCGHPLPFLKGGGSWELGDGDGGLGLDPAAVTAQRALDVLRESLRGRRVVAVAAADLAHVGPAFGDPEPFSVRDKAKVRLADDELLAACAEGPGAVLRSAARIDDRYRICGLSPIALTLAFTGPVTTELTGYDQCPADTDAGSIVSIAGVILRDA